MASPLKEWGSCTDKAKNPRCLPLRRRHSGAEEYPSGGMYHLLATRGSDILELPPFSPLAPPRNVEPNREERNMSVAGPALLLGTFFSS